MPIKAVIFDLDGVILSTDNFHYLAWKKMADKEGIDFNREINERLRGVSRMASLEIILEKATRQYSNEEKTALAEYKNDIYRESLQQLTPEDIFPGVQEFLTFLQEKKIKLAIGSSSKNTKSILKQINLFELFDGAISDGTNITKSKPDPEVFLMAAEMVKEAPADCLVIEDAAAGIEAAKKAKMIALGFGAAADDKDADYSAKSMKDIDLSIFN